MCAPTAISGVIGAIGDAQAASARNKEKQRIYEYKDRLRVNKAMRDDILYKNKKVVYSQMTDAANIAAQRAFTKSQIGLNRAMSEIMLKNMDTFAEMLGAESDIESGLAERGIRGKSMARMLLLNRAKLGQIMARRGRSLTYSAEAVKDNNFSVNIKLKDVLNQQFSRVALQPVRDIPEPAPTMENPSMVFALGAAGAIAGEGDWWGVDEEEGDIREDPTNLTTLHTFNYV